jgi:hypothetical protein
MFPVSGWLWEFRTGLKDPGHFTVKSYWQSCCEDGERYVCYKKTLSVFDTISTVLVVQALILSHFDYCQVIRSSATKKDLAKLQTMTQHTSRLCKGYLTKKESDGVLHQMTWPPQSPNLNPIGWFGMSWTAEWRKCSQQVLRIRGDSFNQLPGEAIKCILICLTPFWLLHDSICVISEIFYNVENSQIKKKPWMSRCAQTFDWYCI